MICNSYTQVITDTFNVLYILLKKIKCKSCINSKHIGSKTFESITINYKLENENNS